MIFKVNISISNVPSFWLSAPKTSQPAAVGLLLWPAGPPGPTGDAGRIPVSPADPGPGYMNRSSRASLSSCACCLLSATCAAITRCRSAISVHFAHTQSLQRQKRLWPLSADTTPWFLHRAHFGVRGYPLSRTGLQPRKKRGGGRRREGGTWRPPSGEPSGVTLLSIGPTSCEKSYSPMGMNDLSVRDRRLSTAADTLEQDALSVPLSRWFDM